MKGLKAVTAIVSCLLLFVSCGEASNAQKAVLAVLKDPDSAKFGDFTVASVDKPIVGSPRKMACLSVNAKNAMGGYTGYKEAMLMKKVADKEWGIAGFSELDHKACVSMITEMAKEDTRAFLPTPGNAKDWSLE